MGSADDAVGQATAGRTAPLAVTPRSQLHAQPRARPGRAEQYLLGRPHGEYNEDDIRVIVRHYYNTARPVGLDPLLVVAQMALETGGLTSFWSQRPRRNPAGIGVTGAPGPGCRFRTGRRRSALTPGGCWRIRCRQELKTRPSAS